MEWGAQVGLLRGVKGDQGPQGPDTANTSPKADVFDRWFYLRFTSVKAAVSERPALVLTGQGNVVVLPILTADGRWHGAAKVRATAQVRLGAARLSPTSLYPR